MQVSKVSTKHYSGLVKPKLSTLMYNYLQEYTEWERGVKSRKGESRLAKPFDLINGDKTVRDFITAAVQLLKMDLYISHCYLNYYRDGQDSTPAHSHPGMKQVIISLGATRTLIVGKKSYVLKNGDVVIFGSSTHSVPRDDTVFNGRISIALFCMK